MRRRDIAHLTVLGFGVLALSFDAVAGPPSGELDRLYVEGRHRFDAGDYDGAVEAWTQLLELIPESAQNRETRDNVFGITLLARLEAVRKNRPDDSLDRLEDASRSVDTYRAELEAVHGAGARWDGFIDSLLGDLEKLRERERAVLRDPWIDACLAPSLQPCLSVRRGCARRSGFDTALLGVVVAAPIAMRRRDVLAAVAPKLPEDVARRLQTKLDDDD